MSAEILRRIIIEQHGRIARLERRNAQLATERDEALALLRSKVHPGIVGIIFGHVYEAKWEPAPERCPFVYWGED